MTQTINIPTQLLKRYRKDKSMWELFVFAVCVKMLGKDSKISTDIKTIRKLMGCSYYKAVRLIENARRHPELFFFYKNGRFLVARSFTHGMLDRYEYIKKNKTYIAYRKACIRFQYNYSETVSHIEVSRLLRDKMLTNAIRAAEHTDGSDAINSSRPRYSRPLSLHSLAIASGYHYTTVRKHLLKMKDNGKIGIVQGELKSVLHLDTGTILTDNVSLLGSRRFYDWHGIRYVREANSYFLVNPKKDDYAVNIIFNHTRRHRNSRKESKPERRKNESYADFANRTFLAHLWL